MRTFVETKGFQRSIAKASKGLLRMVQNTILRNPNFGDLIQGTGGIRKIRVAGEGKGKSGGYRVLYLDLPKAQVCFLLYAYGKSEMENISDEDRTELSKLVQLLKKELGE